jgi:exodeoxyribonuclease VII small subunit
MSKTVKDAPPLPEESVNLPFEEALKRLEGIVDSMENDDLPLESLLAKYEEGTRLAQSCQFRLAEAEVKIQQLERKANGQFALKPLSPVSTVSPGVETTTP